MLIVSCGYFGAARSVKVPPVACGQRSFSTSRDAENQERGMEPLLHFSSHSYLEPLLERLATCESQSYRWPNYCMNSPATWLRRGGGLSLRVFPRVTGITFGSSWFDECCELYRVSSSHHPPGSHILRSSPGPACAHLTPDAGKAVPRCSLRSLGETNKSSILTSSDFTFDAYMGSLSTHLLGPYLTPHEAFSLTLTTEAIVPQPLRVV